MNDLSGKPLNRRQIFQLCAKLEGHPDNAAPAEFGGFTVAGRDLGCVRFKVSQRLSFVLLVPEVEMLTRKARGVLPKSIGHSAAATNCAHACRITAAFAAQDYELLRGCFEDHLHQPYRARLLPCLEYVIKAGVSAGALGGFLSGSGSTIACVTLENPEKVGNAMKTALGSEEAKVVLTSADNRGSGVVRLA